MTDAPKPEKPSAVDDLERLRRLLIGDKAGRLDRLDRRVSDPGARTEDVAEVLPGAMNRAIDDPVSRPQLERPIVDTIRSAIKRDTESFAEALFPVLGPAIRRAVADALKSLVQRINAALEHSFTIKGLRWRLEAARSGVPFAQIVLRETMLYAVQEVFLMQPRSGLVLASARRADTLALDQDAFSAMLTAIQAFIQDSFGMAADERLRSAELGDRTLWTISGPSAVLACVVLGSPPMEVREHLMAVLESLHGRYGDEFEGPPEQLTDRAGIESMLQETLSAEAAAEAGAATRSKSYLYWAGAGAALLLILAWALWGMVQADRLERDVASRFAAEPGYVVTAHDRQGDEISVAGLRDPLAVPPESVLAAVEVEAENVTLDFKPYQSLDEDIVLRRLRTALRGDADLELQIEGTRLSVRGNLTSRQFGLLEDLPGSHPLIGKVDLQQARLDAQEAAQLAARQLDAPASVTISPLGDRLELSGTASAAWFETAAEVRSIAGWPLDLTPLRASLEGQFESLLERIDGRTLTFTRALELTPASRVQLESLAREAVELQQLGAVLLTPLMVRLDGFADGAGVAERNREIALSRAGTVETALIDAGFDADRIEILPARWEPGPVDPTLRKVVVQAVREARP